MEVTLTNFYTVLFTGDVTCPDFLIRFDYLVFQKGVWPGPSGAYSEKSRFEKQKNQPNEKIKPGRISFE